MYHIYPNRCTGLSLGIKSLESVYVSLIVLHIDVFQVFLLLMLYIYAIWCIVKVILTMEDVFH